MAAITICSDFRAPKNKSLTLFCCMMGKSPSSSHCLSSLPAAFIFSCTSQSSCLISSQPHFLFWPQECTWLLPTLMCVWSHCSPICTQFSYLYLFQSFNISHCLNPFAFVKFPLLCNGPLPRLEDCENVLHPFFGTDISV